MNIKDPELQNALALLRSRGWSCSHNRPTRDLKTGKETNLWDLEKWQSRETKQLTDEELLELAKGERS